MLWLVQSIIDRTTVNEHVAIAYIVTLEVVIYLQATIPGYT